MWWESLALTPKTTQDETTSGAPQLKGLRKFSSSPRFLCPNHSNMFLGEPDCALDCPLTLGRRRLECLRPLKGGGVY